jgi:hypothetical protein
VVLVVRGAGGAWCWWCVVLVLVVRGAGGAWCWSCVWCVYAQFVICDVHLTSRFATRETLATRGANV